MTTAPMSMIAPPPSVEAVLGALTEETRIGQVDFSSRLAPEPQPEPEPAEEPAGEVAVETQDDTEDEAQDDAQLEAEDQTDAETAQPGDGDQVAEVVTLTLAPVPPLAEDRPSTSTKAEKRALPPADPGEGTTMDDTPNRSIEDRITGPAHLTATAAGLTEPVPAADFERPPSIEEIARAVVERMHDAELAMMRHLEAIELEADRRAELATAQAELDAELIRLNARREAHAIVTAAREEAGQPGTDRATDRALDEVTESLTRFADVMEELRPSHRPGRRP